MEKLSVERWFDITNRGTTIRDEVRAGSCTFLTLAYVLILNPQILNAAGVPFHDAYVATILSSAFATFFGGVLGNLPFAIAPGLGLSTYFLFGVSSQFAAESTIDLHESAQYALTLSFIASIVISLFSLCCLSKKVSFMLPANLRWAVIVALGLTLGLFGIQGLGFAKLSLNDPFNQIKEHLTFPFFVGMANIVFSVVGQKFDVQWVVIFGMFVSTFAILLYNHDSTTIPIERGGWIAFPNLKPTIGALNFSLITLESVVQVVLMVAVQIIDTSGSLHALASVSELEEEATGHVPGANWVYGATGIGSVLGSLLGSSPLIVHLESASGVREGGRTGLTAVVLSCWLLLMLLFEPVARMVPTEATASTAMMVGSSMVGCVRFIHWSNLHHAIPSFFLLSITISSGSVSKGLLFASILQLCLTICSCEWMSGDAKQHSPIKNHEHSPFVSYQQSPPSYGSVNEGAQYTYSPLGDFEEHQTNDFEKCGSFSSHDDVEI